MSQRLTVELPDELAQRACALAGARNRRLEDAVVEWISEAVAAPEVETLPDDELLKHCDATMGADSQEELSALLSAAREGELAESSCARLDQLMAIYRSGLVQKARAWREAVARGLRPSLSDSDANADHAA